MRIRIIGIIVGLFFIGAMVGHAVNKTPLEGLSNLSEEALQLTKAGHYNRAASMLEQISDAFVDLSNQFVFTMDQVQIISIAHQEAKNALENSELGKSEKLASMIKFRLVMDSLVSTHQPLWAEMEESILSIYNEVVIAAQEKDLQNFHLHYNTFLSQYDLIYPSIKLDAPTETVLKVDARVQYIDEYRPEVLTDPNGLKELEALAQDLKTLFDQSEEDEADPSLWWVILTTGSIIIITLSYVGFRKYKGDQQNKKKYPRKLKD